MGTSLKAGISVKADTSILITVDNSITADTSLIVHIFNSDIYNSGHLFNSRYIYFRGYLYNERFIYSNDSPIIEDLNGSISVSCL